MDPDLQFAAVPEYSDDIDSGGSTPFVSAPSSPGRDTPRAGFYYSAPASPTHHFMLSAAAPSSSSSAATYVDANSSFEFDFSSPEPMTSADELFFNGQIRPMKLSAHLRRPQPLAPLIESDDAVEDDRNSPRSRDSKLRSGSLRRRTRSMSPDRTTSLQWREDNTSPKRQNDVDSPRVKYCNRPQNNNESNETTPSPGRSSRRWISLKDFLYRSKSEGHKFWGSLSFSPVKEKKIPPLAKDRESKKKTVNNPAVVKKTAAAAPSPHELHYTANRAQAEEMRKKTYLPYRQGLLGRLGFSSSKSYGAMNGFGGALNSVSSR